MLMRSLCQSYQFQLSENNGSIFFRYVKLSTHTDHKLCMMITLDCLMEQDEKKKTKILFIIFLCEKKIKASCSEDRLCQ